MIIDNLDVRRSGLLVEPFEANSPLIVDANAVLSFPVASESLEAIPRQGGEIPP
jgi:hypothetical protein